MGEPRKIYDDGAVPSWRPIYPCLFRKSVAQYGFSIPKLARGIFPRMDGLVGTFSRGLATVIDGKAVSTEILSEISGKNSRADDTIWQKTRLGGRFGRKSPRQR